MARITFDREKVKRQAVRTVAKALRWTAADIHRRVKGSIKKRSRPKKKSAWKSATLPDWPTSPTGSPPFSHSGWLKNSIRYDAEGDRATSLTYFIGVDGKSEGGISSVLEKGGSTVQRKSVRHFTGRSLPGTRKSRKKRNRPETRVHPTVNGRTYHWFYSKEDWDAARQSAGFLAWTGYETKDIPIRVSAHPFLTPAAETEMAKFDEKLARATKK